MCLNKKKKVEETPKTFLKEIQLTEIQLNKFDITKKYYLNEKKKKKQVEKITKHQNKDPNKVLTRKQLK